MARWHLVLTCWLAAGMLAAAFAPSVPVAPIFWTGLAARNYFLSPNPASLSPQPQSLRIWEQPDGEVSKLPYFTQRPDKTIATDAGLCVEASGTRSGDHVYVNHCTGKPTQLWNYVHVGGCTGKQTLVKNCLRWGDDRKKHLQLSGTDSCLSVDVEGGLNGAPVELRECDHEESESSQSAEAIPIPKPGVEFHRTAVYSSRHVILSFIIMGVLGALSASVWFWHQVHNAYVETVATQNNEFLCLDETGVCLTEPLAMDQGTVAVTTNLGSSDMALQRMVPLSAVMAINPTPVGPSSPKKNDRTVDKAGVACDKGGTYSHDDGHPLRIKIATSQKWGQLFNKLRCQTKNILNWRRLAFGTLLSSSLKPSPAFAAVPKFLARLFEAPPSARPPPFWKRYLAAAASGNSAAAFGKGAAAAAPPPIGPSLMLTVSLLSVVFFFGWKKVMAANEEENQRIEDHNEMLTVLQAELTSNPDLADDEYEEKVASLEKAKTDENNASVEKAKTGENNIVVPTVVHDSDSDSDSDSDDED